MKGEEEGCSYRSGQGRLFRGGGIWIEACMNWRGTERAMSWPWGKNQVHVFDDQQKGEGEWSPCIRKRRERDKVGLAVFWGRKEGAIKGCHILARVNAWLEIIIFEDGENGKFSRFRMGHQDLHCGHVGVFHLNRIVALQNVWGRWNYFFSYKKTGSHMTYLKPQHR